MWHAPIFICSIILSLQDGLIQNYSKWSPSTLMHLCHLWTHLSNPFWKNSLGHTVVERWRSITRFAFKFGFAFFKLFHPCLHITFNNYHLSINISEANLDVGSSTSFFRQKVHNCSFCFVFNTWNTRIHTKQEAVSVLQKESFYLILI